jgi:hypothetical protein
LFVEPKFPDDRPFCKLSAGPVGVTPTEALMSPTALSDEGDSSACVRANSPPALSPVFVMSWPAATTADFNDAVPVLITRLPTTAHVPLVVQVAPEVGPMVVVPRMSTLFTNVASAMNDFSPPMLWLLLSVTVFPNPAVEVMAPVTVSGLSISRVLVAALYFNVPVLYVVLLALAVSAVTNRARN